MILTMKNYKEALKGISVVEVSGESCANCLTLMPILHRLVMPRTDCMLHHLEAMEETMPLIQMLGVEGVPTILIMMDDKVYAKCKGYQPEEILEIWLDAKIAEIKEKAGK